MIDLSDDLANALSSPRVRQALADAIREALRGELAGAAATSDQFVDAEDAARILGMTVAAVRKAATRGTLPCHRLGRRVRFLPSELLTIDRPSQPR